MKCNFVNNMIYLTKITTLDGLLCCLINRKRERGINDVGHLWENVELKKSSQRGFSLNFYELETQV